MILFLLVNGVFFIAISYLINDLAFKLSIPFLIILGGYSYFKRFSALAHLFLGLALALAPIAGAIAILGYTPLWVYFLAIGVMFWVAGFDLLYALQDMEFDKKRGLHSIPAKYGLKGTLKISRTFHLITAIFWILFAITAKVGIFTYIAVFLASSILFWEQYIVTQGLDKINRAFFTANGYLGIGFLILVVLDFLWM
jgi:4-hydroxybenzoate polyprenyltransferase